MNQASSSSPAKPRRKSKKMWIIIGASVLLIALIAVGVARKKRDRGVTVTIEKAARKTITQLVTATGKVQPETEVKIAPEVSGEIVELPFKEGASVKKGDLLLRIKDDNYRYGVDQRDADLAAARAAAVESKAQRLKAGEDFNRSADLYAKHLISDADYIAAKTAKEVAEASYVSAEAQVRRAEGLLKQAKDQLDKTVIYAPMDGTISKLPVEVGERVAGTGQYNSAEVMRVADLASMEVLVQVNENDVVNVKVGDKARIDIDAFPKREFTGKVTQIASTAVTTGQNTQAEVTNFEVKIRIDTDNQPIKPGMSALADIETATAKDVVAVPIQAVTVRSRDDNKTVDQLAADREKAKVERKGAGAALAVNQREEQERDREDRSALRRVVFIFKDGKVKQVDVETGIADNTSMEIKSGVKEGDEVVSGSYATITRVLKDGMAVTVKKPLTKGKADQPKPDAK